MLRKVLFRNTLPNTYTFEPYLKILIEHLAINKALVLTMSELFHYNLRVLGGGLKPNMVTDDETIIPLSLYLL